VPCGYQARAIEEFEKLHRDPAILVTASLVLLLGAGVSFQRANLNDPVRGTTPVLAPTKFAAAPPAWARRSLVPVANLDPSADRQPERFRPYHVATTLDGMKAYVTLSGKEIQPGSEVAVVDVARRVELSRISVGSYPFGIAAHPTGRWIVVTNRYSNFLSVVDVETDRVVAEIPVLFYCDDLVFSPDGTIAYVTNFWKNQVLVVDLAIEGESLTGEMRRLGFDREKFFGTGSTDSVVWTVCNACGWRDQVAAARCRRCGHGPVSRMAVETQNPSMGGLRTILRASCGTVECHMYRTGGFYAGPDTAQIFQSAVVHSFPGEPESSPLLRATTSLRHGGWADAVDGRHHPGKVVFKDPQNNPDYAQLRDWIATAVPGPGISVGDKPRDLTVSPDGRMLYVANTGSGDISVVDLESLRETRRIFTRSPVNDLVWVEGRLVLATLGVGSGHPKAHDPGRESTDRSDPDAEFTLFRDPQTGRPLPLSEQQPLGSYDNVDGTAQEKFRDITNDIVLLDPTVDDVAAYKATDLFTRYTSDSFEALPGDKKGDVPAELMKVVGAFPEQIVGHGRQLYVTMSGTFEIQEWRVDPAAPPAERLVPGRVFSTGFKPTGIALAGETLVVADRLGESISFVDLLSGTVSRLSLSGQSVPTPATEFELGEFFVQTSVFSADQDQSCVHCHYRDTSDGRRWSVSQVMGQSRDGQERTGGSREVPDLRNLLHEVPFFVEGMLSVDEPLTMMMEHNPLVDFQGEIPAGDFSDVFATAAEEEQYGKSADAVVVATSKKWDDLRTRLVDLVKRRELHFERTSEKYLGRSYSFREFQKLIGAYQAGEPRLHPNPVDRDDPMVQHGESLFNSPEVGCMACHPAPLFTDKVHVYNENKAFPPLVSAANRDNIHTLVSADRIDFLNQYIREWDSEDRGRVEQREGFFVSPSLRGLWARPPKFLHHGGAVSLREVLCTPDHVALRQFPFERRDALRPDRSERGHNELGGLPDTHGTTSQLSIWDIECLLAFLNSIE